MLVLIWLGQGWLCRDNPEAVAKQVWGQTGNQGFSRSLVKFLETANSSLGGVGVGRAVSLGSYDGTRVPVTPSSPVISSSPDQGQNSSGFRWNLED